VSTDIYSEVMFHDGEGLVFTDFNNMARFADARLQDQIFARFAGALGVDGDPHLSSEVNEPPLTSLAYTLTAGDCLLKQGTVATRLGTTAGTIFQRVGTTIGTDAKFLSYAVKDTDIDLTITAGDPTNPRITILQCKLEYIETDTEVRDIEDATTRIVTRQSKAKRRRVQATFSLKNGTAAATPTYPAPDTGYAMIGALLVPANWTTGVTTIPSGGTSAKIRQCTVPLGITVHSLKPKDFDYAAGSGTNWTYNTKGEAEATGAATDLIIWVPGGDSKRIVGVEIVGVWVTSGQVDLVTYVWNSTGGWGVTSSPAFDLSTQLVTTGGTTQSKFAHLGNICDASDQSNPSTADGVVGDPIWGSGYAAGPAQRKIVANSGGVSGSSWGSHAALRIDAGVGSLISEVTFYLAG
jgi:hypothetical protein